MNAPHDSTPSEGIGGRPGLFWVSRRAALIAVRAGLVAASLSILVEYLYPFSAAAHGVKRVAALEFLGSYAIYGFVGCVLLVLLGRGLRRLVRRDEDHYGEGG